MVRSVQPDTVTSAHVAQQMVIASSGVPSTADLLYFTQASCAADSDAKALSATQTASVGLPGDDGRRSDPVNWSEVGPGEYKVCFHAGAAGTGGDWEDTGLSVDVMPTVIMSVTPAKVDTTGASQQMAVFIGGNSSGTEKVYFTQDSCADDNTPKSVSATQTAEMALSNNGPAADGLQLLTTDTAFWVSGDDEAADGVYKVCYRAGASNWGDTGLEVTLAGYGVVTEYAVFLTAANGAGKVQLGDDVPVHMGFFGEVVRERAVTC